MGIYLDYAATTPIRPEVLQVMHTCLTDVYGNASSLHYEGRRAKHYLEASRSTISSCLGASGGDILFTGSGTEANNIAVLGALGPYLRHNPESVHVVTSSIEHPAVLSIFQELQALGVDVTYLPVDEQGRILPAVLLQSIRPNTKLVSIQWVNNEIGTIQPIRELAGLCRERGIIFHTDAVQAIGRIPVDVTDSGVHLLTFSGHKLYGPKGVGVLYVDRGVQLAPIQFGAHHEFGLRPGTENVPAVAAVAEAVRLVTEERAATYARMQSLGSLFISEVVKALPSVTKTVVRDAHVPHILHFCLPYVLGEAVVLEFDRNEIAVSSASACSAGSAEPSHVLEALSVPESHLYGGLRISLGRLTTEAELIRTAAVMTKVYTELAGMVRHV